MNNQTNEPIASLHAARAADAAVEAMRQSLYDLESAAAQAWALYQRELDMLVEAEKFVRSA